MADWSHPDSKLILPASAPREYWLAERRKGIGGSDISAILGLTRWGSPYSVWLDKTGKNTQEIEESPQMRWGKLHEPAMRQAFTEDTGLAVRQTGLHRHKGFGILQITPDGFVEDGGLFESKTGSFRVLDDWTDEQVSDHAALQVMHAMTVTGRRHAHVVALIDGYKWHVRRVEYDKPMAEELAGYLIDWWDKYVVRDVPPPVTSAALDTIKTQFAVAEERVAIAREGEVLDLLFELAEEKAKIRQAEAVKDELEAKLRMLAGEATAVVSEADRQLFTLHNDGTFSPSKFKELVADPPMKKVEVLDMDTIKEKYATEYNACRARVLRSKVK